MIDRILSHPGIDGKLNDLLRYTAKHGIPLYVLIDEYDNFANTILAHRGAAAYESFTHGGGFYRNFFATLKAGAGHGGGVERMFITGVSPITMDDVTSGFNIGTNVSLMPEFNEVLGFTAAEVRAILESYRDHGVFDQDVDEALAVMSGWYNGYRFAKHAQQDLYHTDMVLYYVKASVPGRGKPDDLIDTNVRIDYGKAISCHDYQARSIASRNQADQADQEPTKHDWLTMLRRTCIVAGAGHVIRDGVDPQREHEHLGMGEPERKYQTYPGYRWVVCRADLLGGRPTVIGTRISLGVCRIGRTGVGEGELGCCGGGIITWGTSRVEVRHGG